MDQVRELAWVDGISKSLLYDYESLPRQYGGVWRRNERKNGCQLYYNYAMAEIETHSDEALVAIVRTKDKERFAEIVERYQLKLLRYATQLVHDEQKASDVVQDAFVKAYINLHGFDVKKKFSSWIYRIVHNEAMNAVKKYHKETPLAPEMDIKSDENIEHDYTKKELIAYTQSCLGDMPLLYSEPLALYYLDEKSYDEISDILRIPMGTVATRIARAKKLMKILCQKNKAI